MANCTKDYLDDPAGTSGNCFWDWLKFQNDYLMKYFQLSMKIQNIYIYLWFIFNYISKEICDIMMF